jgi:hypothetical protein
MKLRKELGTDAVRELVQEAKARVESLPDESVRDPWPSSRRLAVESVAPAASGQTKLQDQ